MAKNYSDYTTKQGDTFDILALKAYGNEFLSHKIIQANPQYSDILIFEAGKALKLPILDKEAVEVLPPWKR